MAVETAVVNAVGVAGFISVLLGVTMVEWVDIGVSVVDSVVLRGGIVIDVVGVTAVD